MELNHERLVYMRILTNTNPPSFLPSFIYKMFWDRKTRNRIADLHHELDPPNYSGHMRFLIRLGLGFMGLMLCLRL